MTLMHTASIMTNPSGVATLTADMMQPGTMRFVATFAATSQYASSTAQGDVTVTTRTVATTLTLMLNCCPPVYVGQATEWYVTLTRSDTGGKLIGSATSPTAFPLSVSVDGTFVRTVQSGWQEAGISKSLAGWDTGGATLIVLAGLSVGTHTVTVSFAGVTTVEIP